MLFGEGEGTRCGMLPYRVECAWNGVGGAGGADSPAVSGDFWRQTVREWK